MARSALDFPLRFALLTALALGATACRSVDLSPSTRPPPTGRVGVQDPGPNGFDGGMANDAGRVDAGTLSGDAGQLDAGAASVQITSPSDGASFVQDDVVSGEWAATVRFEVASSGVARVELFADGTFSLGELGADGSVTYSFFGVGQRPIAAIGYDASGAEVARDELSLTITAPPDTGCHAMLDGLGLDWAVSGANRGIADPVRVQPVINGVSFRYVSNSSPTSMLMDCELAVRLHQLTEVLLPYGIDEVIHIGIYNYRCIGGGDPDSGNCTPSQHAYARAIDIHAFGLAGSDAEYNTEDDWVITMRRDPCPIESFSEPDRVLKEIACEMWSERIFQIILTPNYDSGHRNHFHVDLTSGSMTIGLEAAGIDPPIPHLGH